MLKPHHKQYYTYFEARKVHVSRRNASRRMNLFVAISKIKDKKCTVSEFHFFFNKIKKCLGEDSHEYADDTITHYVKECENGRTTLIDKLDESVVFDDGKHPWRREYKEKTIKK